MIRTGLMLIALFAACQANLVCFECGWPDSANCKDGIVEYEVEPVECPADATHCVVTTHKNSAGTVTEVDRACIGGGSKVKQGCDKKDGAESCTRLCTGGEGCNAPEPTSPPTTPTTPTTTTAKASGASDVTVSRLVILAAGALTAMLCLKL